MRKIYLKSSKNIKEVRIKRGYTVSELAEAADISTKFLYDIEAGKTGFSANVLFNIANALNVSCDFIMNGQDNLDLCTVVKIIDQFDNSEQKNLEQILLEIIKMKTK